MVLFPLIMSIEGKEGFKEGFVEYIRGSLMRLLRGTEGNLNIGVAVIERPTPAEEELPDDLPHDNEKLLDEILDLAGARIIYKNPTYNKIVRSEHKDSPRLELDIGVGYRFEAPEESIHKLIETVFGIVRSGSGEIGQNEKLPGLLPERDKLLVVEYLTGLINRKTDECSKGEIRDTEKNRLVNQICACYLAKAVLEQPGNFTINTNPK